MNSAPLPPPLYAAVPGLGQGLQQIRLQRGSRLRQFIRVQMLLDPLHDLHRRHEIDAAGQEQQLDDKAHMHMLARIPDDKTGDAGEQPISRPVAAPQMIRTDCGRFALEFRRFSKSVPASSTYCVKIGLETGPVREHQTSAEVEYEDKLLQEEPFRLPLLPHVARCVRSLRS